MYPSGQVMGLQLRLQAPAAVTSLTCIPCTCPCLAQSQQSYGNQYQSLFGGRIIQGQTQYLRLKVPMEHVYNGHVHNVEIKRQKLCKTCKYAAVDVYVGPCLPLFCGCSRGFEGGHGGGRTVALHTAPVLLSCRKPVVQLCHRRH